MGLPFGLEDSVKKLFAKIDCDKDQALDKSELSAILREYGFTNLIITIFSFQASLKYF